MSVAVVSGTGSLWVPVSRLGSVSVSGSASGSVSLPVSVSVTITDNSGRTLSGQTLEAFWHSIAHADLLSVGINCALGPTQMRPYIEELSRIAPAFTSCPPNAGLPNAFGKIRKEERQWSSEEVDR